MKMLLGIAIVFAGAILTEAPMGYTVTIAILCGFVGTYIAADAYLKMLNQQ